MFRAHGPGLCQASLLVKLVVSVHRNALIKLGTNRHVFSQAAVSDLEQMRRPADDLNRAESDAAGPPGHFDVEHAQVKATSPEDIVMSPQHMGTSASPGDVYSSGILSSGTFQRATKSPYSSLAALQEYRAQVRF